MNRSLEIARRKPEVRAGEDPDRACRGSEDHREHGIHLQREDEEGEQREAPDDEVDAHDRVVLGRGHAGGVAGGGVGLAELQRGQRHQAEGEPEDGVQAHGHHGEEVAHDPLEHHGEEEQHGADEEEYAAGEDWSVGRLI